MSTCKDCLHYEVCKLKHRKYFAEETDVEYLCNQFKPKADYAPVVRCKDCKDCELIYPIKSKSEEPEPLYYCCSLECPTKPTDFCSYGEKESEVQGE